MNIVLIGGGHAHVQVVHNRAKSSWPNAAITVISPSQFTPYSGMLPGYLAGHYREAEIYFDLKKICQRAGVQFLDDSVVRLDLQSQKVISKSGREIAFDFVSLDVGSQPSAVDSERVRELANSDWFMALKPISNLVERWTRMREELHSRSESKAAKIAMIGGGISGVEVAMALRHSLSRVRPAPEIHLFEQASQLVPGQGERTRAKVEAALEKNGIHIHVGAKVTQIGERLIVVEQKPHTFDYIVLATEAYGHPWFKESGLPVDERGFVQVDYRLRSIKYPFVFAAGDCAALPNSVPKSGVIAVRQGPVLIENLKRAVKGRELKAYHPQRKQLALISLGKKRAIAAYGALAIEGAYLWRLKDRIDRGFMRRFG